MWAGEADTKLRSLKRPYARCGRSSSQFAGVLPFESTKCGGSERGRVVRGSGAGTRMLTATAKNVTEGKRESRENFFCNSLFSPPPPNEVLRVGVGLKAEEDNGFNFPPGGL